MENITLSKDELEALLIKAMSCGWNSCRSQVYALAEDTHETLKYAKEGISVGRRIEANGIAYTLNSMEAADCDYFQKALKALLDTL